MMNRFFAKPRNICLVVSIIAFWGEQAGALSLEEAIAESFKTSNEIASARQGWVAAREAIFSSNSTKETSFKYSGSGSLSETDSGSGYESSNTYSNKITVSKNIYDGGQARENLLQAEY